MLVPGVTGWDHSVRAVDPGSVENGAPHSIPDVITALDLQSAAPPVWSEIPFDSVTDELHFAGSQIRTRAATTPLTKETHDDLEYDVDGTLLPSPRRAEHFADRWR